ncbi:MAG: sigma-70 family RNA polymerase sigma factor [Myxococcota bacterium]
MDGTVLSRAQAGDETAFRTIYRHHHRQVFAFLARMLGERGHEAEDLLQETFVRVFRALPRFREDGPAQLSTWILTIAYRLAVNALRRGRPCVPLSEAPVASEEGDPDQELRRRQLEQALIRAVSDLPPEHRAVFVLRDYEDLSYAEIAAVLDLEVGTVKSRLSRARSRVREGLKDIIDA